jgi:hypothetical protein
MGDLGGGIFVGDRGYEVGGRLGELASASRSRLKGRVGVVLVVVLVSAERLIDPPLPRRDWRHQFDSVQHGN